MDSGEPSVTTTGLIPWSPTMPRPSAVSSDCHGKEPMRALWPIMARTLASQSSSTTLPAPGRVSPSRHARAGHLGMIAATQRTLEFKLRSMDGVSCVVLVWHVLLCVTHNGLHEHTGKREGGTLCRAKDLQEGVGGGSLQHIQLEWGRMGGIEARNAL